MPPLEFERVVYESQRAVIHSSFVILILTVVLAAADRRLICIIG
jgi:hypothetical protein